MAVPACRPTATEVFDRDVSFDPAIDAIVRVEAARLRAKLREYYDREGCTDPVRFELPKGAYAIRMEWRTSESTLALQESPNARAKTVDMRSPPAHDQSRTDLHWRCCRLQI
jgi:hypothetical protein